MDEVEIIHFENDLLYAARETLSIKGFPLDKKNYSTFVKVLLTFILAKNDYRSITVNNNARELIKKYNNFFVLEYLCTKISLETKKSISVVSKEIDDDLIKVVSFYTSRILPDLITNKWLQTYKVCYDSSIVNGISNVHFYTPSNICKDAVLSGRQLEVSSSSEHVLNMDAYSDVGKVCENQEDSYYIGVHPSNKQFQLMAVADGMGGIADGEKASNFIIKEIIDWFEKLPSSEFYNSENDYVFASIKNKLYEAHNNLKRLYPGAGTTLCFCVAKNDNLFICNIGDSGCLVLEDDKLIYNTTPDNIPFKYGIPEELNRFHRYSNMLCNCIGREHLPELNIRKINLLKDRKYNVLLCSDGVSDCLTYRQIVEIIVNSNNSTETAHKLVAAALKGRLRFKDEYENYLGMFTDKDTYKVIYNFLKEYGLDEKNDKTIYGGKDNTTAVVGNIRR